MQNDFVYKLVVIAMSILAMIWIGMIFIGMLSTWPFGILGVIGILIILFVFIKVWHDRAKNKDDDYYDKNVFK